MTLSLVRAYQMTQPDPAPGENPLNYLSTAESIYSDVMDAVVKDSSGNFSGIRWHYGQNGRATASNAGPVITGLLLAKQTGNSAYLTQARGFANYIVTHESIATKYGPVLKEAVCANTWTGESARRSILSNP